MEVHRSMDQLPAIGSPVVTMGSFDGVHAGHRVIISRLNNLAAAQGGQSVLITFHPHPRKVLYPETAGRDLQLISSLEEKCFLLEEAGLDHLIVMEFTRDFAQTSSRIFVEDYLYSRLHARTIVVGFNHYFGHNKEGSFESLYECRDRYGFLVEEIPEQEIQNETVSSTKIRKALGEGNIQRANAYLEHHFLMIPNLMIDPDISEKEKRQCLILSHSDENKLIPPAGAYAVSVIRKGGMRKALVRIREGKMQLYPESEMSLDSLSGCRVHFLKYLGSGDDPLQVDLEKVGDLIY